MGNLFLCSGGQSGGSVKQIQRHLLTSGTVSAGIKTFDIRSMLPEGVDYTTLSLDNFAITRIGLNETTTHTNLSSVTPDIPYIYSKIYNSGTSLVNLQKYDNTTGKLTMVTIGANLALGESPNGDTLNPIETANVNLTIRLELFV